MKKLNDTEKDSLVKRLNQLLYYCQKRGEGLKDTPWDTYSDALISVIEMLEDTEDDQELSISDYRKIRETVEEEMEELRQSFEDEKDVYDIVERLYYQYLQIVGVDACDAIRSKLATHKVESILSLSPLSPEREEEFKKACLEEREEYRYDVVEDLIGLQEEIDMLDRDDLVRLIPKMKKYPHMCKNLIKKEV